MRKTEFCLCKNKGLDQLRSDNTADQRICIRFLNSTLIHFLLKSEISSFYSFSVTEFVSDQDGNPGPVFSRRVSFIPISFQAFDYIKHDQALHVDGYHFELIREDRYEDMMNVIRRNFYPDEPMSSSLNVEWSVDVESLVLGNLKQNLSLAMVSSDTGEIVAGQVIKIASKHEPFDKSKFNGNFVLSYDALTNHFDSILNTYEHYDVDELIWLIEFVVKREERQKGFGTKLIEAVKEFVKQLGIGPVVMRVEGTSNYSQRVFEKLGFSTLATVYYSEYKIDDKIVFVNTGEHKAFKLYCLVV